MDYETVFLFSILCNLIAFYYLMIAFKKLKELSYTTIRLDSFYNRLNNEIGQKGCLIDDLTKLTNETFEKIDSSLESDIKLLLDHTLNFHIVNGAVNLLKQRVTNLEQQLKTRKKSSKR